MCNTRRRREVLLNSDARRSSNSLQIVLQSSNQEFHSISFRGSIGQGNVTVCTKRIQKQNKRKPTKDILGSVLRTLGEMINDGMPQLK